LGDSILALLLEGESKQAFEKVLLKYAKKEAQWNKDVAAHRTAEQARLKPLRDAAIAAIAEHEAGK
jgi:hypothetical protein